MLHFPVVMTVLGIDTSVAVGGAAVVSDDDLRAVREDTGDIVPSRRILALVAAAMEDAQLTMDELDALAVAVGPGSFTGLRVGIATANGLGWSLGKPVLGCSTLVAMALACPAQSPIVTVLDARRGEVFAARFEHSTDGQLQRSSPDRVVRPEVLFRDVARPGDRVVGDGAVRYRDIVELEAPDCRVEAISSPVCVAVARLAIQSDLGDTRVDACARLAAPRYLREPHIRGPRA